MTQVFHLDPHPIVRKGLKSFFKNSDEFQLVGSVGKFREAVDWLKENNCEILITEMTLDVGPLHLIQEILALKPDIKIVVFSAQPQNMYAVSLLKAGATAFLNKNIERNIFLDALHQVHKLGFPLTGAHTHLNYNINLEQPRNLYKKLSAREVEVLRMLIDGKRNKVIAEKLGINQKTASTYKKRIFEKLRVDNLTDLFQLNRSFHFV